MAEARDSEPAARRVEAGRLPSGACGGVRRGAQGQQHAAQFRCVCPGVATDSGLGAASIGVTPASSSRRRWIPAVRTARRRASSSKWIVRSASSSVRCTVWRKVEMPMIALDGRHACVVAKGVRLSGFCRPAAVPRSLAPRLRLAIRRWTRYRRRRPSGVQCSTRSHRPGVATNFAKHCKGTAWGPSASWPPYVGDSHAAGRRGVHEHTQKYTYPLRGSVEATGSRHQCHSPRLLDCS